MPKSKFSVSEYWRKHHLSILSLIVAIISIPFLPSLYSKVKPQEKTAEPPKAEKADNTAVVMKSLAKPHQQPPINNQPPKVVLRKTVVPVEENPILKSETYNVKSENQSGGITAGKIENVNIITDKESLGIREPNSIYQNGKKLGTVIDFKANDTTKTFTISEIQFDKPLLDVNTIWQPLTYQKYVLHIRNVDDLTSLMPPVAKGVSGNILK